MSDVRHVVDAERLLCPMPLLEAQKALRKAGVGDTVVLMASDPGAMQDIPMWCKQNSEYELLVAERREQKYYFEIRKLKTEPAATPKKW